jgi:formyltetrahydrofolate deformylase
MSSTYILTLSCLDRPGIVHAVSGFLFERGGNILDAAQYADDKDEDATGLFFMRVGFGCALPAEQLKSELSELAKGFGMSFQLKPTGEPVKTVIMVSKEGHCLNDLLFRWKSGLLKLDVRAIISNHREFYQLAASYNVPFHHIPVTAGTKADAEARQYEIIQNEGAELVVLARYMQILSDDLCRKLSGRAIKPIGLRVVSELREAGIKLPIIAGGGVRTFNDVREYGWAGADACSLGSEAWLKRAWSLPFAPLHALHIRRLIGQVEGWSPR